MTKKKIDVLREKPDPVEFKTIFDEQIIDIDSLSTKDPADALSKVESILALHAVRASQELFAKALATRGAIYKRLEQASLAIADLNKSLDLQDGTDRLLRAYTLWHLADLQGAQGSALKLSLEALSIYTDMNKLKNVTNIYTQLSRIYGRLGDFDSAIEYAQKALDYYKSSSDPDRAYALAIFASLLSGLGNAAAALPIREEARKIFELEGNIRIMLICDLNIANDHIKLKNYELAEAVLDRGYETAKSSPFGATATGFLGKKAALLHRKNEFEDAASLCRQAISDNLIKSQEHRYWLGLFETLISCEISLGNLESAKTLIDSVAQELSAEGGKETLCIDGRYTEYYEAKGEWQLAFAHQKKCDAFHERERSADTVNSLNSTQILLAIEREKHEAEMQKVRAELSEHETEVQQLRAEQSEKELATQAVHTAAQTDLLDRFRNDLRQIVREIDEPLNALKKIKEKLKELPCESVDWPKFEAQFATVHPEFKQKLVEKYPELSPAEIRMCILFRLGLKSHEVAQLTCLSERSVEDHRYQIRKKLGMKKGEDVVDYLAKV